MLHSLCLSLALPFSLFRLRKIQMGCRCCKMIQSYIFDPEEVQSSGCIHEANSYKYNEQGSNKSKFQENSENEEPKNELQQDEINKTENKNPVNSTTETLGNHRGNDSQEDGLVKCAAKLDVAVNGGNSCAQHSMLNPNTSPVKESSEKGTTSQSEASLASNRDFHTESNRSGQELDVETGSQSKAASNVPNSIPDSQSAEDSIFLKGNLTLETENNTITLPDIDYPQNGNQTGNCVEQDSFSVNCTHSDQNTGTPAIRDQDLHAIPAWPVKESSIEPFRTDSASLSESLTGGITAVAVTKVPQAPTHTNHKDINGGIEEEDAEVAAALAALEAATAGEDVEDDDEY
uniref:Chromosome 4 open reading frame 19 n=2 Tax=Junco hyemalis TaxID=40217 RepID=A0A8C5IPA4_JUNHY